MHAEITAIIVHDEKLFAPTGDIGRWASSVAYEFEWNTKSAAPVSSRTKSNWSMEHHPTETNGALRRGIDASVGRTSLRRLRIDLTSSASYSTYVLFGTSRIYSRSARVPAGEPGAGQFASVGFGNGGMYIPLRPGKGLIRQSVSGQRANNFIETGFNATAARHSSLRSMRFS